MEVYIAVSSIRVVNPLMGGVWISPLIPAVFRGRLTGAAGPPGIPLREKRVFEELQGHPSNPSVHCVLPWLERGFESVSIAAGVLHPVVGLLGCRCGTPPNSIRRIFSSTVSWLLTMTMTGLVVLALMRSRNL